MQAPTRWTISAIILIHTPTSDSIRTQTDKPAGKLTGRFCSMCLDSLSFSVKGIVHCAFEFRQSIGAGKASLDCIAQSWSSGSE